MIEKYYDIITKIENFVDGLMIVDEHCHITYNKQFSPSGFVLDESYSIGKTPMEIYPNLKPDDSTCYRAVTYGESTTNQIQRLKYHSGEEFTVIDNTFPVIDNGKIIGAVSTSRYIEGDPLKDYIDLSNMTTTHTEDLYSLKDIIGDSPAIQHLKYQVMRVAQTSSTVLIYGETGTGKELVAQSIHNLSARRGKPFISQNCAAIPQTLLESIFFGTTRGSYTGAENRPGIFELADGGTIFLDEINSMDLNMQAKLLKAIEEKKITRIGGREPKRMNVRILAALNEAPQTCLENHAIRKDLYYRLTGVQIKIPPLRERKSDLEALTTHFIRMFNKEMGLSVKSVEEDVRQLFQRYDWPGNIREFRNMLEGAFHFCNGQRIKLQDLPELTAAVASIMHEPHEVYHSGGNALFDLRQDLSLKEALERFEMQWILLRSGTCDSQSELADLLKISRQTLHNKVRKYGLFD
jgi:arginine utilization regulatory protein